MFNEPPVAAVTVSFNKQPITGMQLAALVQQMIGNLSYQYWYIEERYYHDREFVSFGQDADRTSHDRLRIVPSLDGPPFFAPDDKYSEVKVVSYLWPSSTGRFSISDEKYPHSMVIDGAKNFAHLLGEAYDIALANGFPEYEKHKDTSVWDEIE